MDDLTRPGASPLGHARPAASTATGAEIADEDAIYRKVSWRLVPFLLLC